MVWGECGTVPPYYKVIRVHTAVPAGLLTKVELLCDSHPASGCPAIKGQRLPLTQPGLVAKEELCYRAPGLLLGQTARKWGHLLSVLIGTSAPGRGPCCLCTGGQWICWRLALRSPAAPSHVVKSPEIQDKNIRNSHFTGQYIIHWVEKWTEFPNFGTFSLLNLQLRRAMILAWHWKRRADRSFSRFAVGDSIRAALFSGTNILAFLFALAEQTSYGWLSWSLYCLMQKHCCLLSYIVNNSLYTEEEVEKPIKPINPIAQIMGEWL